MRGYPLLLAFGCFAVGIGLSYAVKVSFLFLFISLIFSLFLSLRWQGFFLLTLIILGAFYAEARMPSKVSLGEVRGIFKVHGSLAVTEEGRYYLSKYLRDGIYEIKGDVDEIPKDKRSYLWSRGFYRMIKVRSFSLVKALNDPLLERLRGLYPEDVAQFIYGAISSDKRGLSPDLKGVIYRSGIGHLLAVSGFHVGILAGALFFSLGALGLSPRWAGLLSLSVLLLYLIYIGFQPSAWRAYLLFLFSLLGRLSGLKVNLLNLLGACGLVLAIWNPFVVWDAGLELSFSAYFFIALALELKLPFYLTYVLPQIGTFPILALRFRYLPIASFLSNLLAIPLFSLALPLAILSLIPVVGIAFVPMVRFTVELIFFISALSLKLLPSINL